jgi:Big-like domain-containing protein
MSPSTPANRAFYRAFVVVIAGLSIGILVLALLVAKSGPWVRQVVVQNLNGDGGIASVNQGLTVFFDRPINSSDFASAVEIEPKTDYTVSHRNQQLSIAFNQDLLTNTDYTLTVKPLVDDDSGRQMEREYTYKFTTAEPSFTYLERNHDSGALDKVIERAPLSQKSYVLFGADRIQSFARNANYLAVVLPRADGSDELRIVDLGTAKQKSVGLPHDVRVDNLRFSPVDNQFVFITRGIPKADISRSDFKAYTNKLYRYDADANQLQPIDALSDEGNVESVLYSRDGQALLYKTADGEYYVTSATQTTEPTLLSKHENSGGFDRTNTKLAFLEPSEAEIYDAGTGKLQDISDIRVGGSISTPTFLHNSDDLIYLRDAFGAQTDEHVEVCTVNTDGKVEERVVSLPQSPHFFGDPMVSYDDRYVLIEVTFDSQGKDDYSGNRQPKDAYLVLYDRSEGKVIDSSIHGIDPVWNR